MNPWRAVASYTSRSVWYHGAGATAATAPSSATSATNVTAVRFAVIDRSALRRRCGQNGCREQVGDATVARRRQVHAVERQAGVAQVDRLAEIHVLKVAAAGVPLVQHGLDGMLLPDV